MRRGWNMIYDLRSLGPGGALVYSIITRYLAAPGAVCYHSNC